jgi:murein DD-endopeptidase MepM/ murein hydrolase activator NlpD
VDPKAADDEEALPLDQLSSEPPPVVEKSQVSKASGSQAAGAEPSRSTAPDPKKAELSPEDEAPLDNPAFRPNAFPPLPPTEVLLDPASAPPPIPEHRPKLAVSPLLSPSMRALFATLFGLAALFSVFAVLIRFRPHPTPGSAGSASATAARLAHSAPAASVSVQAPAAPLPNLDDEVGLPSPWRISDLKNDDSVRIIDGQVGLDPLVETLDKKHVPTKETYRIIAAFKSLKVLDKPNKHTKYTVAVDKNGSRVKAFELEISSTEIYQARENEEGVLTAAKLDLKIAERRLVTAFRITDDLATDLRRGRLREAAIDVINSAFDGRANLHSMPKGSTVRVVMQEQTALGRFAAYEYVEAVEYLSSKEGAEPLRVYRFKDSGHYGYFDQKAREPFRGGWRRPCPNAPITSNFNPKRMHPVLHIIKPHLGTDFGAPTGTPIHATSSGVISNDKACRGYRVLLHAPIAFRSQPS